jgi:hypothetical protein
MTAICTGSCSDLFLKTAAPDDHGPQDGDPQRRSGSDRWRVGAARLRSARRYHRPPSSPAEVLREQPPQEQVPVEEPSQQAPVPPEEPAPER